MDLSDFVTDSELLAIKNSLIDDIAEVEAKILSDYATKVALEEVENDLLLRINDVEEAITDVKINNESIVKDATVNLEEHFKTINDKSIFASENDKSLKCVEKVLIDGDMYLNPEDGVLDVRGVFGNSDSDKVYVWSWDGTSTVDEKQDESNAFDNIKNANVVIIYNTSALCYYVVKQKTVMPGATSINLYFDDIDKDGNVVEEYKINLRTNNINTYYSVTSTTSNFITTDDLESYEGFVRSDNNVQHMLGGLVVGSNDTPTVMQGNTYQGRVVLTGVNNPLLGVLDNSNGAVPYYVQAYNNEMYIGGARGKAIKIDSNGKVTVQKSLVVTDSITEGGKTLSNKYVTTEVFEESESYMMERIDAVEANIPDTRINNISIVNDSNIVNLEEYFSNINYPLVNHGTGDTTFTLTPNTFHVWDNVTTLELTIDETKEFEGVANEYLFQFSCLGDTATSLVLPENIKWANGEIPTLEVTKTYQVSILNNCATYVSFE